MIYNKNNLNRELNNIKDDNFYNFTSENIIYKKNTSNELRHKNKEIEKINKIGIIDLSEMEKFVSNAIKNSK